MAAIQQFDIKTAQLDSDIRYLEQKLRSIKNEREEMIRQIEQLSRMWDGEAKESFALQFKVDCSILQTWEKNIEKKIEDLKKASREYSRCETRVGEEIRAIRIGRS